MSRILVAPIALACTLLCAAQARADNVSFAGFANGSQSVDVVLGAPNVTNTITTQAGGFSASLNGGASFVTYCIDLYEYISFGTTYSDYTLAPAASHDFSSNANAAADIGKLYAGNHLVNSSVAQAAFQIAIWEIAYEADGLYDLSSGSAKFSGGNANTALALEMASTWLGELAATTNNSYNVWALDSVGRPGHQDQVFATPVPEPSTYAMLAGGLLAIGFASRRRSARQG